MISKTTRQEFIDAHERTMISINRLRRTLQAEQEIASRLETEALEAGFTPQALDFHWIGEVLSLARFTLEVAQVKGVTT